MTTNRVRKYLAGLLAVLMTVCVILPASVQQTYAYTTTGSYTETSSKTSIQTTVTGVPESINKRLKQNITFTVKVKPAYGRKVKLQRYNSAESKWETIYTYKTDNKRKASVTMTIEKKDRQKMTAKWRVYVPAKGSYSSYKSPSFKVITRNVESLNLSAGSAVIYRVDGNGKDGKGTLIYTKNSEQRRAQASTTKLMTAVLVMESGKLESATKITRNAAKTPWGTYHMKIGDKYRNHDLMYALLLPSANDAATALAEGIGGTESNFVSMMNRKARQMGLKNTQFRNPHGLDASGHYTTAVELAKLTAYAYTFPTISEIWNTKVKTVKSLTKKKRWTLWSTNAIFGYDSNFRGGKTGTTGDAGCCFTGVYVYKGKTYVTTVLGSSYGFSRWSDTQKLHKYIRMYAESKY